MHLRTQVMMRQRIVGLLSVMSEANRYEIIEGYYKLKRRVEEKLSEYSESYVSRLQQEGVTVSPFQIVIPITRNLSITTTYYGTLSVNLTWLYSLYDNDEDKKSLENKLELLEILAHLGNMRYNHITNYTQLLLEFPFFEKLIVNNTYKVQASEAKGFNRMISDEVRDLLAKEFYILTISRNFVYQVNNKFELEQRSFNKGETK